MVLCYATLVSPLRLCIGPACEAGLSTGTYRGHMPPRKRKKEKKTLSGKFIPKISNFDDFIVLEHGLLYLHCVAKKT